MNGRHDPELDDVLQDEELRRLAVLLTSTQRQEPPLDDAFRSGLLHELAPQAGAECVVERRLRTHG